MDADSNSRNAEGETTVGWAQTHTDRIAYQEIKRRARKMRQNRTRAEETLWQRLRRRQVNGFHFRSQHPIGRYIVDFYCAQSRLVVEVDGSVHDEPGQQEYDSQREAFLEEMGLRLLRFKNEDVMRKTDAVIEAIALVLQG